MHKDIKGVIIISQSQKNRKCNNKKKRRKRTNNIIENTIKLAEVRVKQIQLIHERFGK
jgi:hypothetical protein